MTKGLSSRVSSVREFPSLIPSRVEDPLSQGVDGQHRRLLQWFCSSILVLFSAVPLLSQTLTADSGLAGTGTTSFEEAENGFFGLDIALSSDRKHLLVGAPGAGSTHIFSRFETNLALLYTPVDTIQTGDVYTAVATDGTSLVGAAMSGGDSDVAEFLGMGNVDELISGLDSAAYSLVTRPGLIAVGMPDYSSGRGRVRVYRYSSEFSGWISDAPMDGGSVGDRLGTSLAMNATGDFLVAGAPGAGDNGEVETFVYASAAWTSYQSIEPPSDYEFQTGAGFGTSLSLANDWLVVGAPYGDKIFGGVGIPAVDAGIVEIYEFDLVSYVHRQRFQENHEDDHSGTSVSIGEAGETLLLAVGVPGEGPNRTGIVRTYWLSDGTWSPGDSLISSSGGQEGSEFGTRVAVAEGAVAASAPYRDVCGTSECSEKAGVVLLFDLIKPVFSDGFESGDTSLWQ